MQAGNPGHISINNRALKVQRWQPMPGKLVISLLIHGDSQGRDVADLLGNETVSLIVGDAPAVTVNPDLTVHQVVGTGPTAVHRIEATMCLPDAAAPEATIDSRLDQMQREIDELKAEIADLRAQLSPTPRPKTTGLRQSLMSGQTMIESDIEIHDVDPD